MLWDTFLFSDELDTLELRLWETEDVVDRWLIAESRRTHSGLAKPLYYAENKERFARWNNRIEHAVFDLFEGPDQPSYNWHRECHHRTLIGHHLCNHGVKDDDIVMLSDVDEIPAEATIKRYRPEMGIMGVETPHSYYWLNTNGGGWGAIRIGRWKDIVAECGHDFQRYRHINRPLEMLRSDPNVWGSGGWHLSFMGGIDAIKRKLLWYQHSDAAVPCMLDSGWIRACIWTGMNLFAAVKSTETNWFTFIDPIVLPKRIDLFPQMLASGVKFNYPPDSKNVREAFVHANDYRGKVISDDGLLALAIAAGLYPDKLRVRHSNEQFWHNVKTLGATNIVRT